MKIVGTPPQTIPTHSRGKVVWHYRRDGTVVVQKWPRRRPGPLPRVTQEQVVVWDAVQAWLPYMPGIEVARANLLTDGTAFYTRDMLIMASYGHHFSYPGRGTMPNGPAKRHE